METLALVPGWTDRQLRWSWGRLSLESPGRPAEVLFDNTPSLALYVALLLLAVLGVAAWLVRAGLEGHVAGMLPVTALMTYTWTSLARTHGESWNMPQVDLSPGWPVQPGGWLMVAAGFVLCVGLGLMVAQLLRTAGLGRHGDPSATGDGSVGAAPGPSLSGLVVGFTDEAPPSH
jgi:hypothetical protein